MAKAYLLPFCLYLLGTNLLSSSPDHYPLGYSLVVVGVSFATWLLLRGRNILKPHARIGPGVLVGVLGIGVWIGLCELGLERDLAASLPNWLHPAPRVGFNPNEQISDPVWRSGFVAVRLWGLVVLVPLIEELFWRGFLARWLIEPNWQHVPLGVFSVGSFLIVVALFTLAHPEWLAAACYCAMLNGLLMWKRDLWNCVVAHAVSNLLLSIYILSTASWELW